MTRLLKKICAILFPVAMLVPTGCSKEEVIDISRDLAVVVRVPADVDLGQRTPGDPGSASSQQIPRYLYFFTAYTPTEPSSAQSRRVSAFSLSNLSSDSWTPVENATGTVVNYLRTVILPMPATDEVMLYVIASHDPIPDLQAEVESVQGGAVIDEAYIGNLMLSARQSGGGTVSIADVYAGKGTLLTDKDKIDTNATIVCYHVAAKFDVMNNLSDDFRKGGVYENWRVASFTLKNLLTGGYYFKPAENVPGDGEATTYTFEANEGNNFYGRFDTYIFQPAPTGGNALSFTWEIVLTDDEGKTTQKLENTSVVENFETEYATYFRLNVTVNGIGQ